MLHERPEKRRWHRSQRFILSESGVAAESAYREGIVIARGLELRAGFDAARATWAAKFQVDPDDGVFLGEVLGGPLSAGQLAEAVETSGKTLKETHAALGRLFDAGFISALNRAQ